MKISERNERLLKALHACGITKFKTNDLMYRCAGLARATL